MRVAIPLAACFAGAYALAHKRGSLDDCAYVDAELMVPSLTANKKSVGCGHLNLCLCVSGIPALLKSNAIVASAVSIGGEANTQAALKGLITSSSTHKACNYPDHYSPICSASNPCGWECRDGFTASPSYSPTECICKSPKHICNGVCTSSPCPSPAPKKRSVDELKKRAVCDAGFTACGVYNRLAKGLRDPYECIDATSDLESCGGCSIPLHENSPVGVDCTSLPGISDVSCIAGSCVVHRCMPGYEVSYDNSMCVDVEAFKNFVPASSYGLEHIPLGM